MSDLVYTIVYILHMKLILINSNVEDRIHKMSVHGSYLSQMNPFSFPSLFKDINITSPRLGLVVPSVRFLPDSPQNPACISRPNVPHDLPISFSSTRRNE